MKKLMERVEADGLGSDGGDDGGEMGASEPRDVDDGMDMMELEEAMR